MSQPYASRADGLAQAQSDAAYSRWAPIYDLVFDLPFHPGRVAAARAAAESTPPDGELLVVGVGTGLELALLAPQGQVTGIDLSEPMLKVARARVAKHKLGQVRALIAMDACGMSFEAGRFDCVMAPYVLSVVPDPGKALDEIWRVLKPGGELIIMNHFSRETGLRAGFERWLAPFGGWLGWHPVFDFAVVGDWAAKQADACWRERREVAPANLFTLVRIGKRVNAAQNC